MKIQTKYFGEIEISEEEIITFPEPIVGFNQLNQYFLISFYEEDDSMLCLQSAQEPTLAFVVLNPFYMQPNYEPRLTDEDLHVLKSNQDQPLAFYVLAVVKDDFRKTTVNLKCPIAINLENRLAKQIIMEDDRYSIHASLAEIQEG